MNPKANILFQIFTPAVSESPLNILLAQLFVRMLEEELSEITYNAYVAGSHFSLEVPIDGIHLYIYGYTDSLKKLSDIVFEHLINFKIDQNDHVQSKIFKSQKDKLIRKYHNYDKSQAYEIARYKYQGCMYDVFPLNERIAILEGKYI